LAHSPFDLKLGNKGSEHTRESRAKRTNSTTKQQQQAKRTKLLLQRRENKK